VERAEKNTGGDTKKKLPIETVYVYAAQDVVDFAAVS
jgi:hypothetical protein